MKRTPLRRKTPLRANPKTNPHTEQNPSKKPSTSLTRKKRLRVAGHSETAELKRDIQALLRQIVILRDGGCVLRHYPETGACGPRRKDGELVLQAEHLNSRSHSATFADPRNVICLCQRHHIYWKPQNSWRYWDILGRHLTKDVLDWLERARKDTRAYKMDWKLEKIALTQHLEKLRNEPPETD